MHGRRRLRRGWHDDDDHEKDLKLCLKLQRTQTEGLKKWVKLKQNSIPGLYIYAFFRGKVVAMCYC